MGRISLAPEEKIDSVDIGFAMTGNVERMPPRVIYLSTVAIGAAKLAIRRRYSTSLQYSESDWATLRSFNRRLTTLSDELTARNKAR